MPPCPRARTVRAPARRASGRPHRARTLAARRGGGTPPAARTLRHRNFSCLLPPVPAAAPALHARCDAATCRVLAAARSGGGTPCCTYVATPQLLVLAAACPGGRLLCTHVAMPQPLELCTCPPSVPEAGSVHAPYPRCPCVYTRGASLVFVSCLCTCSCRAAFAPVFVCVSRGTTCFLAHVHGRYREVRRVAHLVACSSRPRGMGSHQRLRTGRTFEPPARHGLLPFPAPTPPERGGLVAAALWRRRGGGAACLVSPCALRLLVACCSCCRCPRRSRDARAAHVRAGTHRVLPQRV